MIVVYEKNSRSLFFFGCLGGANCRSKCRGKQTNSFSIEMNKRGLDITRAIKLSDAEREGEYVNLNANNIAIFVKVQTFPIALGINWSKRQPQAKDSDRSRNTPGEGSHPLPNDT